MTEIGKQCWKVIKVVIMFEKEAEKYSKEYCADACKNLQSRYRKAFRDGAEFGYNKAFVEADKNLKAAVADFNKANEWHYIKDGDLPKESEGKCFYLLWFGGEDYRIAEYVQGRFSVRWFYVEGVIAWKEIVPPAAKDVEK